MDVNRKVIAAALLSCMFLLSGCEPGVHELQQQNEQQQQKIAQLESALTAAQAGAIQQDLDATALANAQLAYAWAGPLRWLPVWPAGIDQPVDHALDHAPNWKGYLLLGAAWSGLLLVVSAAATAAWLSVWLFGLVVRKSGLEGTIKRLEAKAQPLRGLQKSLHATRAEIERISAEKSKAQAGLDEIKRRIASRRQDLDALNKQCTDLEKDVAALRADLETLRGFS